MSALEDGRAPAGRVLVLGSVNMDVILRVHGLPKAGETVLGEDAVLRPGGKGANQAVAAALAGARVTLAGRLGDDHHADSAREALGWAGVDLRHLHAVPGRSTGLAVVLVGADGENAIAVSPGANHALAVTEVDELRPAIEAADVLLLQLELPLDAVVRAIELAAEAGTPVVLNLAPAADLPPTALAGVAVLVVNRSEAEHLLGGATLGDLPALLSGVALLRALGPRAVVLTAGADGAVVGDGHGTSHLPAIPVRVVDTSGAGDAFAGVLACELSRGRTLHEAVEAATRAGAAAVQLEGAQLAGAGGPDPSLLTIPDHIEVV